MSTHRSERVAAVILDVLARVLRQEVRDPRIGFVTLTGVKVSPDLKHASVYVSLLGEPDQRRASLSGLTRAAPFLRRVLGGEARLRFTPELHFLEDPGVAAGSRVERLLEEIREEGTGPDPEDP